MNKEEIKKDETFKIYEYLKKEPSVIFAVASGFIAVVTALLNFVAISIQRQYFLYWNVSTLLIEYDTKNIIYQLCASAVICLCGSICMFLINTFFAQYFKEISNSIQEKTALKQCKKMIRKIKVQGWLFRILLFTLNKTRKWIKFSGWYFLFDKCRSLLENKGILLKTCEQQAKKVREIYHPQRSFAKTKLFVKLLFVALGLFGICLLFGMSSSDSTSFKLSSLIVAIFIILLYSILGYWSARIKLPKKKIKKHVIEYLNSESDWEYLDYKNEYSKNSFKEYFSDSEIKKHIISIALLVVFVIVFLSVTMTQTVKQQKVFHTVEIEKETYIVMHKFDDKLLLEKVVIKDNIAKVDVSEQIIVSNENITLKYNKFDKVIPEKARKNNELQKSI